MFISRVVRVFSCGEKVFGYNGRLNTIAMSIFLCLLSGGTALAQAKVTVESEISKSGSLVLEVQGVDDVSVSATPVERISPNGKQLYCAYDIDITKDGHEWQPEPEQPAMVSMENTNFADGQLLDIYHEGVNGLEFVATVASENGKITFPAHSFSVYIVAAAGDYARMKVNLHKADGTIVTIYVKKLDVDRGDFNRIFYNPGFGTIRDGVQCRGWIAKRDYTEEDIPSALTIDEVRDIVTDRLNAGVEDGTEIDFYTMLFKSFSVMYLDENDAVINHDVLLFRADKNITSLPYTVSTNYTPRSNTSKFEGWMVKSSADGEHIVGHTDDSHIYTLNTEIDIKGNITFNVVVSDGFWLIYHENGKGATYKAADFVHAGETTTEPTLEMLRNGYMFLGWYTGEPATQYGNPTGSEFVFGQPLEANTHVYAKWKVNEKAQYAVIVWKQNVTCDGYDFDTVFTLEGTPNTEVSTVSSVYDDPLNANTRYAQINGVYKKYTGFYLNNFNEHINIAPEGNSIVNVYYDRIEYTVKFIYCRKTKNGNTWQYASKAGDNASSDYMSVSTWATGHPSCTYSGLSNETIGNNYTYYYYPITARYGQSIREWWPQYEYFPDIDGTNKRLSSWILMVDAEARGTSHSVKGLVSTMDEQILGDLTSSNGNYLVARYETIDNLFCWKYNIWFPTVAGEDYAGRTTCTHTDGVSYYLEEAIPARSGKKAKDSAHRPALPGYSGADSTFITPYRENETTPRTGDTIVMNYFYSRNTYKINYMDGSYYNGNNVKLNDNPSSGQLHEIVGVVYGSDISSYGDYVHTAPRGFVFEGWYVDEPCTRPYNFNTKMPSANVTVYAKWRQIQYRVFLHPNVSADDETLFWGSDNQALNFRIDYGNKISVPTGTRDDYEFVGWYTDERLEHPFSENTVVLNDANTVAYDKTTEFTDPMDKWGNGATWNAELYYEDENTHEILPRNPERFWITRKYDLYGKWRAKLRGANGITVVYEDNEGAGPVPTEELLYQDNVDVIAAPACSYVDDSKVFSHWVLQHYDVSIKEYKDIPDSRIYPGTAFTAYKDDSKMVVTRWFDPEHPDDFIEEGFDQSSTAIHPIRPSDPYVDYLATYTIKLRAEYEDVEKPEHTFIEWFWNDGSSTVQIDGTSISAPELGINVAVNPPVPTRTGYNFKGWYMSNESSATISDCEPNFLFYNGVFYKESTYTNAVTTVAADKYGSTEYMYAIWEPIVDFTFAALCPGDEMVLPTRNSADVLISGSWEATTGVVSGTTYTASGFNDNLTFTPNPSTCAQPKDFAITINTPIVDNVSSYDYIWKGTSTDWNTASNWYVYNNGYSIATEMPTVNHNIYIGPSQCVKTNWPSQTAVANAHDITIASGATLTIPAGKTLNIAGNLDNIGTLDANGFVVFCGAEPQADQTISNNITLANVSFNNRGGNIVPSGSMTITGDATFTNGNVDGDVTFGENSRVENAENMTFYSFVNGTVTKAGNANGFTFPTGQADVLGKIKVSSNVSNVSVRFFHNPDGFDLSEYPRWWNPNNNCAGNDPRFDHVSNVEYWNVASTAPLNATLTVSAKDGDAHFNELTVTHDAADIYGAFWNGSCWENVGGANHNVSGDLYGTISLDVTLPATRSTYDKILSIGSIDHNTILPIELMSFSAVCNGRYVNLEWTTATERNNDYFIVERSDDAINFAEIARVAGAGNSIEQLDYSYTDYSATSGDNYYRLVQVDYDGTRTASEIVVASCSEAEGEPYVLVFPNPFHNDLTIHMENFDGTIVSIEVYDMLGKIVLQKTFGVDGNSEETMLQLDNLPNGTYNVRISTKELVINKQVVKN